MPQSEKRKMAACSTKAVCLRLTLWKRVFQLSICPSFHQNRIMDPGGIRLATGLRRSASLTSLTVSHNFMMEESARAFLSAAASSGANLREVYCDGNLFDEE